MLTTTDRPTAHRRPGRGRRLAMRGAAVAAVTTLGLGLTAVPAEAARHNPCATQRAIFRAHMNEARFFINAADTLAAAGNSASADAATAEAYHFMAMAEGVLNEMSENGC